MLARIEGMDKKEKKRLGLDLAILLIAACISFLGNLAAIFTWSIVPESLKYAFGLVSVILFFTLVFFTWREVSKLIGQN